MDRFCDENDAVDEYGFIQYSPQRAGPASPRLPLRDAERRQSKWVKMVANFPKYAQANPEKLRRRIHKGIPNRLRNIVWQLLLGSHRVGSQQPARYEECLATPIDDNLSAVIGRDLGRTFPTHCYFRQVGLTGQQRLCNVLHAYAAFNPEVGYCQGMGFVTAVLIIQLGTEMECFWMLERMMSSLNMAELYKPSFPLLQEQFFILTNLLKRHCPRTVLFLLGMVPHCVLGICTSRFIAPYLGHLLSRRMEFCISGSGGSIAD
eukprot:TRINITY_DN5938_c0_g1_i1.p1 TRINITY_DN5938_c0_g1~~TRINITY_DN5938_c0_g1_i1.p1  ORF type:complete len:262 (-),score=15.09 TRINITY_DN5938_c0_g1_i1:253-1038(-)